MTKETFLDKAKEVLGTATAAATEAAIANAPAIQAILNSALISQGVISEADQAALMDALAAERRRADAERARRTKWAIGLAVAAFVGIGAYVIYKNHQ